MVTTIPGSDLLTSALNVIAQSLQIPVILFLLAFAVFSIYIIGSLISEYSSHKKVPIQMIRDLVYRIANCEDVDDIIGIIKNAHIQHSQKVVLISTILV